MSTSRVESENIHLLVGRTRSVAGFGAGIPAYSFGIQNAKMTELPAGWREE